jgi:hypothetical protein
VAAAVGAGHPVDPEQLRAHASNLDTLRARFGTVRSASQQIEQGQAGFGPLCGWIFTGLGDRHVRQDELIAYVEENLLLAAEGLRRVADGEGALTELSSGARAGSPGEGTATIDNSPGTDTGSRSPSEIVERVIDAVKSRDWVEDLLADAAPVVEFAAPVTDSYTALRAGALAWAMAYIQPLRGMLDDLTGLPDVVASHASIWSTMATDLGRISTDLRSYLDRDLSGWHLPEVRGYLAMMSHNVEALTGLADVSTAMALITKAAGDLILLTRDIVRGLVADLVTRMMVWLAETTAALPMPVTASQLATAVAAAWRSHAYVTALVTSMTNLSQYVDG